MSIGNSLLVSLITLSIVFAVLAALYFILKIETWIFIRFNAGKNPDENGKSTFNAAPSNMSVLEISEGELELISIDEPTAAMIMAITSQKLDIPLNKLKFKSIKALD